MRKLTDSEINTIIAGLRLYQKNPHEAPIGAEYETVDIEDIDALCECIDVDSLYLDSLDADEPEIGAADIKHIRRGGPAPALTYCNREIDYDMKTVAPELVALKDPEQLDGVCYQCRLMVKAEI